MNLTFDKEAHEYFLDGAKVPGVTTVLQRVGLVDYSFLAKEKREEAMLRGRWVMDLIALYLNRARKLPEALMAQLIAEHPEWMPYFYAWQNFESQTAFIPLRVEAPVFSEQYRFAGTLDLTGFMKDRLILADVKTGIAPASVGAQTAAYHLALSSLDYDLKERYHERLAIELHADGSYRLISLRDYALDRRVWLAALTVYNAIVGGK